MKILLTSPFAHPEVRRGAERYVHGLLEWLATAGHDARLFTSTVGPPRTISKSGHAVAYLHRGPAVGRGRIRIDDHLRAGLAIARADDVAADVVQSNHYVDAAGLRLGHRRMSSPHVLWVPGVLRRGHFGGRPIHRLAWRSAVSGASRIITLSRFAAGALEEEFGLGSVVVPPAIDAGVYAGPVERDPDPTVFCAAAADDARKRVALLVEAFVEVYARRPDVRLVLAPPDPTSATAMVDSLDEPTRARVEVREVSGEADLAEQYRRASVTVLPSVSEAFGLVLAESLAAGTPVVGTNHGAIPDIAGDDTIGALFERDDPADLARRILDVLELSTDPGTVDRCRAAATRWDWATVGPRHLEVYESVA